MPMVPPPPSLPHGQSWTELWKELNQEVHSRGAFERVPRWYVLQSLLVLGLFLVGWGGLLFAPSWPIRIALALLTGFATVQSGLIGHDAGHKAVSGSQAVNNLVGQFFFSFLSGYSFDRWTVAHNKHHVKCNEGGVDPDMELGYLAVYPEDAASKKGLARFTTRFQHILLPLALLAQPYSMITDSVTHLIRSPERTRADRWCVLGHVVLWGVIPALILGPVPALINFMIRNAMAGPYMSAIFLFNHVGAPTLSQGQKLPFFYQQVITSRNLADHWLLNFLTGGLNHQIEHHLFPAAPRTHFRVTRPLVQALCEKNGVPYQEVGYLQATVEVWSHFRAMARVAGGQREAQVAEEPMGEVAASG